VPLRPDQDADVARVRDAYAAGAKSVALVRGTGTGKTFIFSTMAQRIAAARKRVVTLVHRDELLAQVSKTFGRVDLAHGVISSGAMYDSRLLAHVASVGTVVRRLDRVAVPDYLIIDETHHVTPRSMWGKTIAHWRALNPNLRILGVTATLCRLSGEGFEETFDTLILGLQNREAIQIGVLCPYQLIAPPQHASIRDEAGKQGGEVSSRGLTRIFRERPTIVGDAIAEYRARLDGKPAIAFCHSVAEAEAAAQRFRDAGFQAASIDGSMCRQTERPRIVQDLERGALNVMTSCALVDEGFDCPNVAGIIDLYPTESLSRAMQRWGRPLRTHPDKQRAIIIDMVGNTGRMKDGEFEVKHGLPDFDREWSLEGRKKNPPQKSDAQACRQCMKCYSINPAFLKSCKECGAPFVIHERRVETVEGELQEVDLEAVRIANAKREQASAQSLADLLKLAAEKGRSPKWAHHVHAAREKKAAERAANAAARQAMEDRQAEMFAGRRA
jgi:DNA repair protein RadD